MRRLLFVFLFVLAGNFLFAQTNVSVPVDHAVYYLLDQAEARGLCAPLPAVKPLTRARVVEAINEILAAEPGRFGKLSEKERSILENARAEFTKGEAGMDLKHGMYRFDNPGKNGVGFSGELGIAIDSLNSAAYYKEESEAYIGTDTWGTFFFRGDVGKNFSFGIDFSAGVMRAQRAVLGEYDTYATELTADKKDEGYANAIVEVDSQPKAFFPYTYQRHWDGYLFGSNLSASGMEKWPEKLAIAPKMLAEMSGMTMGDMLLLRAGRVQREWGAMIPGSSLVFNASARPFLGVEAVFNPISWFTFSSLTGILEYDSSVKGNYRDSIFQNAFSIQQVEFNIKKYVHIDFGSTALWPKRFELGYLFPLLDNFYYQNFIGDYDNMSVYLNLKGRYPGLGSLWFSVFVDEVQLSSVSTLFERDRQMFAYQAGLQGLIPGIPFASLSLSYTKIEPYTYTHAKNYMPWYDRDNAGSMSTAYMNNGVSLGYYLPPNSDELKVRFDIRPWLRTASHLQYQLIRHGADFGPHQVDGSSLVSELDPEGRNEEKSLTKDFLNDGAYEWTHVFKIGAEHKLGSFPLTIYGEAGVVYSYFKDVSDDEYAKYVVNPPTDMGGTGIDRNNRNDMAGDYKSSTAFIFTIGFKIFW